MTELAVIRALAPLRERHPWLVPGLVVLGLFAALSEGVGLSLFLPLLYSIDPNAFAATEDSLLGQLLERAVSRVPEEQRLLLTSLGILVLVFLKNVLTYLSGVLGSWTRTVLVHSLRTRIVDELTRARLDYTESRNRGELLNALQNQSIEVGSAVGTYAELLVRAGTTLLFALFLLSVSWKLTLAVGGGLLVISLLVRLAWRGVGRRSDEFVSAWDELSQRCLEVLTGMRTLQVFDRADDERRRFEASSREVSSIWFRMDLLSGLVRPVSEFMVACMLLAVLVATLREPSSLPTALTFAFILYRIRPQVQGIDVARAHLLGAKAPVQAVMALVDPSDKPRLESGHRPFQGLADAVRFEQVDFRYPGEPAPALRAASFAIPARRTTAILGRSGAGKSTLVRLLLRLADPSGGRVTVDGVPLPELDLHAWRRRVAFVDHDAMLFNTSVWENIAYGHPEPTDERVRRAARRAGAEAFVEALPRGFETRVGDDGVRLSAGQRQRIALARALVREPSLLVLDEATSSLDEDTEAQVLGALAELGADTTIVVVSHRPSAVAIADHFVLVEDGRVRAEGGPEVIERSGPGLRDLYAGGSALGA